MRKTEVTFFPDITVHVPAGSSVLDAAREAGLPLDAHCGGKGTCGKCRVLIENCSEEITSSEIETISREDLEAGWRLACQVVVGDSPLAVEVPAQKRPHLVKADITGSVKPASSPLIKKIPVTLPGSAAENSLGFWECLQESLAGKGCRAGAGLEVLRSLPDMLQKSDRRVTAVVRRDRVIALEPGDTAGNQYGLALDIGTTTVAGSIIDLRTGREVAAAADLNRQNLYGADIISRIDFAAASPAGLNKLTGLVRAVINDIIRNLTLQAGIDPGAICAVAVVGNTCMLHLFAGINPGTLAVPPFKGIIYRSYTAQASELEINAAPWVPVLFLPAIAGYVGADTMGVILATGLYRSEKITLAIDIGTNGEIVLGSKDRMLACAAAAGPAFEGANISAGMRAAEGAIDRVAFDGDSVTCSVIGGGQPKGICGSGLIDAVAGMLEEGLIDVTGRLVEPEEAAAVAGPQLALRIRETERGREFLLAGEIAVTQKDIRQVQLAKGAIQAGIRILQGKLSVSDDDIEEVLLAGSFGSYIDIASASRLGLFPPVPLERVRHVGNAAHQGAKMALVDEEVILVAETITSVVEYVELSNSADFAEKFAEAMFFSPHPAGDQ